MSNVIKHADTYENFAYIIHHSLVNTKQELSDSNKDVQIINQAKLEAYKIITEAREQALNLKKCTEENAKLILEEAKNAGYEQGFALGKQTADEEIMLIVEEIGELLLNLKEQRTELLRQNETLIKELSINISKKIINSELDSNSDTFINLYRNAVQECTGEEWIKVSVSDMEYEFASANSELLLSMVTGAKHIEISKLEGKPKGTCIVETAKGITNACVETQLERISEALSKAEMSDQEI